MNKVDEKGFLVSVDGIIEVVGEHNLDQVLPLIRQYQTFYKVADICDKRNRQFFSQFGENNPAGCQYIFRVGEQAVGFATLYFSFSSTIAAKVAVMNDLFALPEVRGKGVGKQLIEHCRKVAAQQGSVRLQWMTAPDNKQAQTLYDGLNAAKSEWYFYAYKA